MATAFPFVDLSQDSRAPMLPGFRFLFAAILLTVSLFIFGLGAASFLRAAHQAFAVNPTWRGAAEVNFAQRNEANPAVLATLRLDPPTLDSNEPALVAVSPPALAPAVAAPVEADVVPAQVATLAPANTAAPEIAKTDDAGSEQATIDNPPAVAPARQAEEMPGKSDETKVAADTRPEPAPARSEPARVEPEPAKPDLPAGEPAPAIQASATNSKIATLGGAPVEIVPNVPAKKEARKSARVKETKEEPSTIKKQAHERRRAHRRRLVARARLAAQQLLQQQQSDPFAQPWPGLTPTPSASVTPTAPAKRRRISSSAPR